jgi:hypothetical protein
VTTVALPRPTDQVGTRADTRSVCVVIPIPDDPPWDLFDAIPTDIPILVSDDSDGRLAPPPRDNVYYFDYAAQEAYAGRHYAAMPHKSAASRNIGHYIAWKEGFDVIVALDYDCRTRPGWLEAHLEALRTVTDLPATEPAGAGGWVNPIRQSFPNGDTVYARGYPYERRTPELAAEQTGTASGRVALNLGVWDGILDLNGIDKLYGGEPGDPGVPSGPNPAALGHIPVCGMNTAFLRELTPAYYFLPDLWVNGWQLSRHDDIWGGYVVKRLMDRRGDLLTYGGPVVEHTKQTRLERVMVLEQWMHLMSVPFYDLVDSAVAEVTPDDYAVMFAHFVQEYQRLVPRSPAPPHYREVFRQLGDWMSRWAAAFA